MKKRNYLLMATDLIIPVLLLIIITILFRSKNWDILIQYKFWSNTSGWYLKDTFPWRQLYLYGNIPALLISLTALIVYCLSFFKHGLVKYHKLSAYLIAVMILGPGIIINSVLKQNWGRPRPRDVVEFGGYYQFEQICDYDRSSGGNSFPCGHASMGFFFFAPAILLRRSKLKFYALLLFSWVFGLSIGLARIIQGGHFASDVIWSAMIVYWVSYLLYYVFALDKSLYSTKVVFERLRNSKTVVALAITSAILLIGLVFTASPYNRTKRYDKFNNFNPAVKSIFNVKILDANVQVNFDDNFEYLMSVQGFGFPGSKLMNKFSSSVSDSIQVFDWNQTKKGFFSEFSQQGELEFPTVMSGTINIEITEGDLLLNLKDYDLKSLDLNITLDKGNLFIFDKDGTGFYYEINAVNEDKVYSGGGNHSIRVKAKVASQDNFKLDK